MEFPDDEVMIVLAGLAMGSVNDGESKTMLHLEDKKRSCDVEVRPRVLGALEDREWIEIDDNTAVKVTRRKARTPSIDGSTRQKGLGCEDDDTARSHGWHIAVVVRGQC